MRIRVGPAGWSYKDWAGIVYPKQKSSRFDPLRYLSKYFDAIEVDSTFYRPMPRAYAESWAARGEDNHDFRFAAKLWTRFTPQRATPWSAQDANLVREWLRGQRAI